MALGLSKEAKLKIQKASTEQLEKTFESLDRRPILADNEQVVRDEIEAELSRRAYDESDPGSPQNHQDRPEWPSASYAPDF